MNNRDKISKRIVSILIDHVILTLVIIVIGAIYAALSIFSSDHFFIIMGLTMVIVYSNKDFLNGQSFGKRKMGLYIIDIKTGQKASVFKCFMRNLTLLLWPVEFIILLINPNKRIGDHLANTTLVYTPPSDIMAS